MKVGWEHLMEPLKSVSLALFRVKEQQIKQRSHLRFTGQCWKLASLMKTMHVTCDSEVNHGTRPDGSVHGSLSHLLPRTQLFQRMLSGWQIKTFFIPFCSLYSCLTDPLSLSWCPDFVPSPLASSALTIWATLPPGATRLLHLPFWKSFQTLSLAPGAFP